MTIRLFHEADLPDIFEIYSLSKLDELRFEDTHFELLPLPQDEKRYSLFKGSDIYVYDQQAVLAYAALHDSEIRSLYVHPHSRGLGIGKLLLEFSLSTIEGNAFLYVVKSNYIAINLYLRYGFTITEEFEADYNGLSVLACKMQRFS